MGNRRRSGKRGRGKRKYMQVVQNAMPSIVAITGVSVQEIPDFWDTAAGSMRVKVAAPAL